MPHKVWALVSFFLPIKIQIFIMHQLLCDALSRKKKLWSFAYCWKKNEAFRRKQNLLGLSVNLYLTKIEDSQCLKITQKKVCIWSNIWKINHTNRKKTWTLGRVKIETFLLIFKDCEGGITRYIHAWKMTPSNGPDPRLKTDSPPVLLSLTGVKWFKIPPQDRVFKLCNICQLVEAEKFDNDNLWIPW